MIIKKLPLTLVPSAICLGLCLSTTASAQAAPELPILNWQQHSDWINVTKEGAKGDGVADDTAAIQRVLDRVSADATGPQTIYFPAGTYRITQSLTLTKVQGAQLVGHGRTTRLIWDGADDQRMFWSNGASRTRYQGLVWDGRGRASVGIDHDSQNNYETRVRHKNEAFLNFKVAGIRVGGNQTAPKSTPSAEIEYTNCLFRNCESGVSFLSWNDYDNAFDGCEFLDCGRGINCVRGNVYVRNCHFERNTKSDLLLCSHSHSVRRSTSVGSARFIETVLSSSACPLDVQDCRVDSWTAPDGAILTQMRGPLTVFDCAFTNAPNGQPPIRLANPAAAVQLAVVSNNSTDNKSPLIDTGTDGRVLEIPVGKRGGLVSKMAAKTSFFSEVTPATGEVFDVRRDFGAKADGTSDDSDAIIKAVQAAKAAGKGASVYLPAGEYIVSKTINLGGSNYNVGGTGWKTVLNWKGATNGTMFAIHDPQNITLEQMRLTGPDTTCRIRQTSDGGPSSIIYDGIFVGGSWLRTPGINSDKKGALSLDPSRQIRGLECVDLPTNAVVRAIHFDGSMRFTNCSRATIFVNYNIDGVTHIEGAKYPKTGFLGFLTRINSGNVYDLRVSDNQNLIIGDYYTEQTQHALLAEGREGQPAGRITIQGSKIGTETPETLTVRNYAGRIGIGRANFHYQSPMEISQQGNSPLDLILWGSSFWKADPQWKLTSATKLSALQNVVSREPVLEPKRIVPVVDSANSLASIAASLDDLRELGEWDLRLNHPSILSR
jgi:hypothetical protein